MKKKIIGICIILVITLPIATAMAQKTPTASLSINQNTELTIRFYGSLRMLLLPIIGFDIGNVGDESVYGVIANFTVDGGFDDMIYLSKTWEYVEILPGDSKGIAIMNGIYGFGSITVSLCVETSNTDSVEKSAPGFQIGYRSFIFG